MSSLNTGSGQEVSPASPAQHTDNNAESESDNESCNNSSESEVPSLANIYIEMLHLFKEALLVMMFIIAYAAISHDPPKVSRSPPAFPFFPEGSPVKDWYRGEISAAISSVNEADVGVLMFYAPWDAESQEVRAEFELAARHMHNLVSFSAINCWQPGSECRNKYSKVYSWPVIIAYTSYGRVVQYNGPKTAVHLVKFLTNVVTPYKRINSSFEIYPLQVHHDAIVVGSIDIRPGSPYFAAMYSASLKFLEKDPFGEIAFRVISKSESEDTSLKLYLWNETLVYPDDEEFRSDAIVNWITKHLHQVTMWVAPTGTKSQQLSLYLQGPTLILFTPQNPLAESMDYYNMLKISGIEYFNCGRLVNPSSSSMNFFRELSKQSHQKLLVDCKKLLERKGKMDDVPTITYSPMVFWVNNTCSFDNMKCNHFDEKKSNACFKNSENFYKPPTKEEVKGRCREYAIYKTSMVTGENDNKSALKLLRAWEENLCKITKIAEDYLPPMFSPDINVELNITGFSCKTNNSLTFIALDSLTYHHFAEKFGIDILKQKNRTALLIVNEKEEVHHVFDGYLSDRTFRQFVINYTNNNLPRALHTSSIKFIYSHAYSIHKDCKFKEVCIQELDSYNFMDTVMSNKVVIVLYYSKQCSFCNGISYIFLSAAKLLSSVKNIQFTRIDGDLNTLPWEYTMETYPSILFFPRKRKSESRAYPQDLPITVSNLISFILTNLNSSSKLHVMWTICQQVSIFMMVSGLILSYDNDPTLHALPSHIARELKNYHVLAIRYLFGCFHNKQNGVILNEDYGMDFPLQMVTFLSTFRSDILGEDPILVITAEDNVGLWKQYISNYTEFRIVNLSDYDEKPTKTQGLIILGSDTEFKKAVTLKDSEYFMVVVEGLEKVITMRALKGLQGVFHVGFTHRNFYKDNDLKLMWQMLKWVEPSAIGKFNDFSEEYNDYILSMIEPFQEIWFRLTWNFSESYEKPPMEELDLNSTKQKSAEKRRSTTKKRKSDEYKTSTTKKRRSNETAKNNALSTKKQHSILREENNISLYTSIHSSSTVSLDEQESSIKSTKNITESSIDSLLNSSREQEDGDIDSLSPIREKHVNFGFPQNSSRIENLSKSDSPRTKQKILKRMFSHQSGQGIEYPDIIFNSKDNSIKISPKKETYVCSTLKCSPQRKKRRCDFESTSNTSRSLIDLFEDYNEKNNDTPDTACDNPKTSKDQDNDENESSVNDFSLSLDYSPKYTENIFRSDENESSVNDFSLSLDDSPKTKFPTKHDDLVSTKINVDLTSPLCDRNVKSYVLLNDTEEKIDASSQKRNLETSSPISQPVRGGAQVSDAENLQTNKPLPVNNKGNSQIPCQSNVSKFYSTYNNKPSTSTKIDESVTKNKIGEIPAISTNKKVSHAKHSIINNDEVRERSITKVGKKGKTFGKHKSASAIMNSITDEAVIKEFSSDFLESSQKTQKFLRKTKSDTNLTPKTRIIDNHVLEEFAKDFPMNPLPGKMSLGGIILRNVRNFFDGNENEDDENMAGPSNSDSADFEESPKNIWSLFRKSDDPKPKNNSTIAPENPTITSLFKNVPPIEVNVIIQENINQNEDSDDNSVINSILKGTESVTSSIRSIYSQETQIIDKEPDCLNCSGKDGKVVEFCIKCNKSISKKDKSTQSDFDEMGISSNRSDDIFEIFNSRDTAEIARGGSVSQRQTSNGETEDRVSLATFFGERKNTIRKKYSREEVLSSIFDDDDEEDRRRSGSCNTLFNEDNDDEFNDLDLWSISVQEEKSQRVKNEILRSLFGE